MGFRRFVENGRVVLITYGPLAGRLAVIVNILDENRVLIDGPTTGVARQVMPLKRVSLTDLMVPCSSHGIRTKTVRGLMESEEIERKWAESSWGKKLAARKRRAEMTDFERFEVMLLKKARNSAINQEMEKLKGSN
mmetsp:Transcript_3622/g.6881  ORF Transcript_3622/g.6881 Transcript_3622/m.6881 type:complete len:136 (-) Transcript_3622:1495-1902(-)